MSDGQGPAENDKPTPRAIVAGHGDFANGLVSAVDLITGRGGQLIPVAVPGLCAVGQICGMADKLVVLSMMGMTPEDIERSIREQLARTGAQVIFTDLQAGSCTMAARRILRGVDDALLIAGVNLPTLLDFVFADQMPVIDAARRSAERGRSAITVVGSAGGVKQA